MQRIVTTEFLVSKVKGYALARFTSLAEAEAFASAQAFETEIRPWTLTELVK
jgi:hypothetical protein